MTSVSHAFNHSSLSFEQKIGLEPVVLRIAEKVV